MRLSVAAILRLIVLGLAAGICVGCSGFASEEGRPDFEDTCPRGLTRPFTVHSLIKIAREHGISLKRDPSCYAYIGGIDAASNVVDAPSNEYDFVVSREGHVMCDLGDDPQREIGPVTRTKYPEDQETSFNVGNIGCTIYPVQPGQVERLRIALQAVARGPVERRDCPRTRPRPIAYEPLVDAARAHGIELRRDERCSAPGVVAQAANVLSYEASAYPDSTEMEQGRVTCLLRGTADPKAVEVQEDKATVTWRLRYRNVECWITPLPDTNEHQVDALRAVFDDLSG